MGRDGALVLRFARRNTRTVLAQCRFTLPLQALAPAALSDGTAYLMLLNPSGGLVGGDRLTTRICLEPAAHACLTTPSATKVYRTLGEPALHETTIELGARAIVEYLPDHVIPYAGAALCQVLRLDLGSGSCAIVADAFAAGRVGRGERWQFDALDSLTVATGQGRRLFVNRTKVIPSSLPPAGSGMTEGFNYVASLLIVADGWQQWVELSRALGHLLRAWPQVSAGVSVLARGGCFVRYMTNTAWELTQTTRALWAVARRMLLGLESFDLRKI